MDNKLKIVFILSSLGGPKLMRPLFSKGFRLDVVYIIYQTMPSPEFLDALIQCLREELPLPITQVLEGETPLTPGHLYFVCNSFQYDLKGTLIVGQSAREAGADNRYIDRFLFSLIQQKHEISVIALSGVLLDQDGVAGIRRAKEKGAKVFATHRSQVPVSQMIEEMVRLDLIDLEKPVSEILDSIQFTHTTLESFEKPHQGDPKWLVVDDEADVRGVIADILDFENITCDFASDGLEALRRIQKNHYGAVLLDIKMPELDGLQTLHALQTVDPTIPILIVTGFDDKDTRKAAQKYSNVVGILLKPFMSDDLRAFIPELLSRRHKAKKSQGNNH